MTSKQEFMKLIKAFYDDKVIITTILEVWYHELKRFTPKLITEALAKNGKYRMNNLNEITKYCEDQTRDKNWKEIEKVDALDEETKAYAKDFYKRYCDTEEEYQEKIKKYGLE